MLVKLLIYMIISLRMQLFVIMDGLNSINWSGNGDHFENEDIEVN